MSYEFVRRISFFADLPDEDLRSLAAAAREVRLAAAEQLFAEGSPGDTAYVIKEGKLEVLKQSGRRQVLLAVRGPGDIIGEMAPLEDKPRMATVRAKTDAVLLAISKAAFDDLINTSPAAVRAMFYTILSRWQTTEGILRHSERMVQLGTLTAGVAHELNNPAAAVRSGSRQLRAALADLEAARAGLDGAPLDEEQRQLLGTCTRRVREGAASPPAVDGLARSDREDEVETWLDERGVPDAWELAQALVDLGLDTGGLQRLEERFGGASLPAILTWLAANRSAFALLAQIEHGSQRISDVVQALKSYSYLDQAPAQRLDIHVGLDDTLLLLRNKLKHINVRREYGADVPEITAYGSELNQVWTNLLDNAADAVGEGGGQIIIRTRHDPDRVVVEIEDDGPGIPEEVQSRIFDAFFTTKPPGHGTGLGLDVTYNIVVHRHGGDITFNSEPGRTVFTVALPLEPDTDVGP